MRENRYQKMTAMNIDMHAISTLVNIPVCTSIEDIQVANLKGHIPPKLNVYIIQEWPHNKDEVDIS